MNKRTPIDKAIDSWSSDNDKVFRLRAESHVDVLQLIAVLSWRCVGYAMHAIVISVPDFPMAAGVEALIKVRGLSLAQIKEAIRYVPDGHVMFETVAEPSKYTGERTYNKYEALNPKRITHCEIVSGRDLFPFRDEEAK